MSTCQTCADLRASWSPLDNGEVPPRCPEHKGSSGYRIESAKITTGFICADLNKWAFTLSDGRGEIIRINYDGTARINPDVPLDEASKLFWATVQQTAAKVDHISREAAAFRAMARFAITVGSLDGKRYRASSRLLHGAAPDEYPSELEAVEAMALACERASQALSPWPTAEGLEIASPEASITLSAAGRPPIARYSDFNISANAVNGSTTANHPESERSSKQ